MLSNFDDVLEELESCIDYRYRDCRPIAVATNLTTSALAGKYTERVISRWAESCEIVVMGGRDRRLKGN